MRPEDNELARLINRFIPVRITNLKGVDLNRFRFDYDLTFAILAMNPNDETTYCRYGSRDAQSATSRVSIAGLKKALRDVLAIRAREGARHPLRPAAASRTLLDIPAYASSRQASQPCAHCHFANNFRLLQAKRDGTFDKSLLFMYPLPENIGLELEVDRNNVVRRVIPGSPASKSLVKAGDILLAANGQRIVTGADLQFVLNELNEADSVTLELERGGKRIGWTTVGLAQGWRRTDISWRASQGGIPPSIGFWGQKLPADQRSQRGIASGGLALRVTFLFPGKEWEPTRGGLRQGDIIVALDGADPGDLSIQQFHSRFRLTHEVARPPPSQYYAAPTESRSAWLAPIPAPPRISPISRGKRLTGRRVIRLYG